LSDGLSPGRAHRLALELLLRRREKDEREALLENRKPGSVAFPEGLRVGDGSAAIPDRAFAIN
jgi:hypothetical protein